MAHPVLKHSLMKTIITAFFISELRLPILRYIKAIFTDFFFLQYKVCLNRSLIPVNCVDHPLDKQISFDPSWVGIYRDFIEFWVQIVGFLLKQYGKKGIAPSQKIINTMTELYPFAAKVYKKNMSTAYRPKYFGKFHFILIHTTDPHLMCIPSLHIMTAIRAYTIFRETIRSFGDEEILSKELQNIYNGAIQITEAVLYVKQHSLNCVPATMYTMSRFDPPLFSQEEAEKFVQQLFINQTNPNEEDATLMKEYIISQYGRFMLEGKDALSWEEPLIYFLQSMPKKD
jgi:hypothetical protein